MVRADPAKRLNFDNFLEIFIASIVEPIWIFLDAK